MKNKKINTKLITILSILLTIFLISASSLNIVRTQALVEGEYNQYNTDSFGSSAWNWTTTEVVSTESTWTAIDSSIAIDSLGNVHVVWSDDTDYAGSGAEEDIFYKKWDTITNSWSLTEVLTVDSTTISDCYPSMAVDSSNNIHVVWQQADSEFGTVEIFYKRWDKGTISWNDTVFVSTESGDSILPCIATDNLGNVHIAWEDYTNYAGAGTDLDIFYKRWDSLSASWLVTEVVSTESTADSKEPSLCTDSLNNVHIVWEDDTSYLSSGTDSDIFYKRWDSYSSSWTITEVVSTESIDTSIMASIEIDSSNNVHVVWEDLSNYAESNTDWDIFYKKKSVSRNTWSLTEVVSFEIYEHSNVPALITDSLNNVHIVWSDVSDYADSGSDWDIFYKRYDVSSNSWALAEIVSTESTSSSSNPSLAIDSFDTIHCVWEDTTDYAGSGAITSDIFYKKFTGSLAAPELAFIVPNPTELSSVSLVWDDVDGATEYYIYRSISYIWSVEGLTPITTVVTISYIDSLPSEGYYFYVIVASDGLRNSTHSNCEYIEYKLPTLHEFFIISSLIIGLPVLLFVVTRIHKKKSKMS